MICWMPTRCQLLAAYFMYVHSYFNHHHRFVCFDALHVVELGKRMTHLVLALSTEEQARGKGGLIRFSGQKKNQPPISAIVLPWNAREEVHRLAFPFQYWSRQVATAQLKVVYTLFTQRNIL